MKALLNQLLTFAVIFSFTFVYAPQMSMASDTAQVSSAVSDLDLTGKTDCSGNNCSSAQITANEATKTTDNSWQDSAIEYMLLVASGLTLIFSSCSVPGAVCGGDEKNDPCCESDMKRTFFKPWTAKYVKWLYTASNLIFVIGEIISLIKSKKASEGYEKIRDEQLALGETQTINQIAYMEEAKKFAEEQKEILKMKKNFASVAESGFIISSALEVGYMLAMIVAGGVNLVQETKNCPKRMKDALMQVNGTTCNEGTTSMATDAASKIASECAKDVGLETAKQSLINKGADYAKNALKDIIIEYSKGTASGLLTSVTDAVIDQVKDEDGNISEAAMNCVSGRLKEAMKEIAVEQACCTVSSTAQENVGDCLVAVAICEAVAEALALACMADSILNATGNCRCSIENAVYLPGAIGRILKAFKSSASQSKLDDVQAMVAERETERLKNAEASKAELDKKVADAKTEQEKANDNLDQKMDDYDQGKASDDDLNKAEEDAYNADYKTYQAEQKKAQNDNTLESGSQSCPQLYKKEVCAWEYLDNWIIRRDLTCIPIWEKLKKNKGGDENTEATDNLEKAGNEGQKVDAKTGEEEKKSSKKKKGGNWLVKLFVSIVSGYLVSWTVGQATGDASDSFPIKKEYIDVLEPFGEWQEKDMERLAIILESASPAEAIIIMEDYFKIAKGETSGLSPLERKEIQDEMKNETLPLGTMMGGIVKAMATITKELKSLNPLSIEDAKADVAGAATMVLEGVADKAQALINAMVGTPLTRSFLYVLSAIMSNHVRARADDQFKQYGDNIDKMYKTIEYLKGLKEQDGDAATYTFQGTSSGGLNERAQIISIVGADSNITSYVPSQLKKAYSNTRSSLPKTRLNMPDFGTSGFSGMSSVLGSVSGDNFGDGTLSSDGTSTLLNAARQARKKLAEDNKKLDSALKKMGYDGDFDLLGTANSFHKSTVKNLKNDLSKISGAANFLSSIGSNMGNLSKDKEGLSLSSEDLKSGSDKKFSINVPKISDAKDKDFLFDDEEKNNSLFSSDDESGGDGKIESIDNFEKVAGAEISDRSTESIFKVISVRYLKSYSRLLEEDKKQK